MVRDEKLIYTISSKTVAVDDKSRIEIVEWEALRDGLRIRIYRVSLCDVEIGEIYSDTKADIFQLIQSKLEEKNLIGACLGALTAVVSQLDTRTLLTLVSHANSIGFEDGRESVRAEFRALAGIKNL